MSGYRLQGRGIPAQTPSLSKEWASSAELHAIDGVECVSGSGDPCARLGQYAPFLGADWNDSRVNQEFTYPPCEGDPE